MNDITAIRRKLERLGYAVIRGKSGHWKVYDNAGNLITVMAYSPNRPKSRKTLARYLRKAGIDIGTH